MFEVINWNLLKLEERDMSKQAVFVVALALTLTTITFVACGGGGGGGQPQDNGGPDTPSVSAPLNITPIGMSSFALGVPSFPVDQLLDISKSVGRVATNELYTFPEQPDRTQITAALKSLIDEGYDVFHEIHILNGPGMRKSTDSWINGVVGKHTSNEQFIDLLKSNQTVKNAVDGLFAEVVAEARALEAIGVEVVICPELEDNHTHNDSYNILLNALYKAGWTDKSKIVRNTHLGSPMADLRKEVHASSLADMKKRNLRAGDIQNNDGQTMGSIPQEELAAMAKYAQEHDIVFYLWIAEMQGLRHVAGGKPWQMDILGAYDQRNYSIPEPEVYRNILVSNLNLMALVTPTDKVISKFLWKPKATSPYNEGKLVIHVDACDAVVVVNGEALPDYGPGNGRCNTSRSQKTACSYGNNVKVEVFDIKTNEPYMHNGLPYVTVPSGCDRFEIP